MRAKSLLTILVSVLAAWASDVAVLDILTPDTLVAPGILHPAARITSLDSITDSILVVFTIEREGGGFHEQFTDTIFPPPGWQQFDEDGGTFSWHRGTTHVHTPPAYATCLREASLLANDDWLVTPRVKVNAQDTVYFWFRALGSAMESIRVRLSYGDSSPASFTHWIQAFDFNDNSYQLGWADFHEAGDASVYIGFQYKMRAGQAGSGICLDDIMLRDWYSRDSVELFLAIDDTADVVVGSWNAKPGHYVAKCRVYAASDTNPANDVLTMAFEVREPPPPPSPWTEKTPMPLTPSGKDVKRGGWLAYDESSGLIYAAKGYKTGDFYSYSTAGDFWTQLPRIGDGTPGPNESGKGGKGVVVGSGVYATLGNNTEWFLRYDIPTSTWAGMDKVPEGWSRKKVKGGTDLVYVPGDTDYVYLLKGYKNEFYRYDLAADAWEALDNAPAGTRAKYKRGSWIVWDGDQKLYVHKARYHELWTYHLGTGEWATASLAPMPYYGRGGRKKKAKDGGSAAFHAGRIFALKGGNSTEFWMYDTATDVWTELDSMPAYGSSGRKKRVKYGADLVHLGDYRFYALKGNKTRELWTVTLEDSELTVRPQNPEAVMSGSPDRAGRGVRLGRNPVSGVLEIDYVLPEAGPVELTLHDAAGRLVGRRTLAAERQGTARVDVTDLPAGVYLLKLKGEDLTAVRKVVLRN